MQVGHLGGNKGATTRELGRVAKIWVDPKSNEAYIATAISTSVSRDRRRHRQMKRYWRLRQQADDTNLGRMIPRRPAQQFRTRCTASSARSTTSLCMRPPGSPAGVQARHLREGGVLRQEHKGAARRASLSPRTRSSAFIIWPRPERAVALIVRETLGRSLFGTRTPARHSNGVHTGIGFEGDI